jgi:hypothetical protein
MKRVNLFILILGSMAITSLLIACGSSAEPTSTASDKPAEQSEVPRITAEKLKKRLDDGEISWSSTRVSAVGSTSSGTSPGRSGIAAVLMMWRTIK